MKPNAHDDHILKWINVRRRREGNNAANPVRHILLNIKDMNQGANPYEQFPSFSSREEK